MVRFKKVEMNNFMAIKNATLELENQGLILIEGVNKSNDSFDSNGSAKSTLVSSITYALYGKTEKGLKADDVVNRYEKKNTYVKLTFTLGNDSYRIERYRKDKKHKNKVLLFLNDQEITGSSNDVTDSKIHDLFKIDFNTYVNAIVFGQGDIPMFSQATDKGKKEILESITGVAVYKQAQEIAKGKVTQVEQTQDKLKYDLNTLDIRIENVDQQYQKELDNYNQLQNQIGYKQQELERISQQVEKDKQTLESEIENLESQKNDINYQEFEYPQEYYTYKEQLSKLQQVQNEYTVNLNTTQQEKDRLYQQQSSLDTSSNCPVCGSPIDNSHKLKELENIKKNLETLEIKENQLKETLQKITQGYNKLQESIQEIDSMKQQHDNQFRQQTQHNQQIDYQINQLRQNSNQGENQLISLKSSIDTMKQTPKPQKDTNQITEYQNQKQDLKNKILDLNKKKVHYENAVKSFGNQGIRSVVLDFVTPFLNEKANKYLQTLSGSDIEIEFKTQVKNSKGELKDKFDIVVSNKSGGTSYKANSAGEQRRIDLAISFAIQDLIMQKADLQTNIALYDECFDGLDTIGCENVIKLLKERLNTVSTIFVITHNQDLKSLFEKSIKVVKENNESRLEL